MLNAPTGQPEMVALPSTGFQVAAWLWRNGYSTADNSSLPTGNLGMYFNGSEYSFLQLSYKIQLSTTGIEKLFQYWRHTVEVYSMQVDLFSRSNFIHTVIHTSLFIPRPRRTERVEKEPSNNLSQYLGDTGSNAKFSRVFIK